MKKYSKISILFLILAALKHLETAAVPMVKEMVKDSNSNESGEWVYESFSVTVDSESDGENGFKIDKAGRETELIKKYELYKAAEEEKKMAAKMAELKTMEAEIEAKKAQMETKMTELQAELTRKLGKKPAEVTAVKQVVVEKKEKVVVPEVTKAVPQAVEVVKNQEEATVKVQQKPVAQQKEEEEEEEEEEEKDASDAEIEILRVPEIQSKPAQVSVMKQEEDKPQVEPKKINQNQKRQIITPAQYRNSVRFSQNLVQVRGEHKEAERAESDLSERDESGTDTSESDSDSDIGSGSEKSMKREDILKAVMASKEIKKEEAVQPKQQPQPVQQQQQPQPAQQQPQQQQAQKQLNLSRMSTRVPAACPIVVENTVTPTTAGPERRSILKLPNQGRASSPMAKKSVTLINDNKKSLTGARKSQGVNINDDGFDGDDDDDYFKPKTGRQPQQQRQFNNPEPQHQNFYDNQSMMSRYSTNTRQSYHPHQYDYEEEQEEHEQIGHDLSGIRLGFCEAALLGTIANIKMISMKYPRQANSVERKKTALYITSLIENFPCDKEKEVMKKMAVAHPPIYTERRGFSKWTYLYIKSVLKETKCPVGVNMNNLLVPLKKK